jgi:hypothetical protein
VLSTLLYLASPRFISTLLLAAMCIASPFRPLRRPGIVAAATFVLPSTAITMEEAVTAAAIMAARLLAAPCWA